MLQQSCWLVMSHSAYHASPAACGTTWLGQHVAALEPATSTRKLYLSANAIRMHGRAEDREALRKLIKVQYHYQISPEVSRELESSRCTAGLDGTCLLDSPKLGCSSFSQLCDHF